MSQTPLTRVSQFRRRAVLLGLMGVPVLAAPGMLLGAQKQLGEVLNAGGYVIYFRHGATTWSGVDRIEWPRERQRLLSEEGISQSRVIGAAFQDNKIPVGEVLASPFARCRDMAEIAFGRVEERPELMGLLSDSEGVEGRRKYVTSLLITPPESGRNRVIVSHRSNIFETAGVSLREGEAAVFKAEGSSFGSVAQVMPDEWSSLLF